MAYRNPVAVWLDSTHGSPRNAPCELVLRGTFYREDCETPEPLRVYTLLVTSTPRSGTVRAPFPPPQRNGQKSQACSSESIAEQHVLREEIGLQLDLGLCCAWKRNRQETCEEWISSVPKGARGQVAMVAQLRQLGYDVSNDWQPEIGTFGTVPRRARQEVNRPKPNLSFIPQSRSRRGVVIHDITQLPSGCRGARVCCFGPAPHGVATALFSPRSPSPR